MAGQTDGDNRFESSVEGLRRGDFSALAPLFDDDASSHPCQIVQWLAAGRFRGIPDAVQEAFTCACFLGKTNAVRSLLAEGVDPQGGAATGMNALHWAVNRGQLETVNLLLETRPSLEVRNMYGGTVLGMAIWSAIHEPRAAHGEIIETLLKAGARRESVEYPTGDERIDSLLERYGARSDDDA